MGCANTKRVAPDEVAPDEVAPDEAAGPDMVLLRVADLLNNRLLSSFPNNPKRGKKRGMTSYDVLEQHWNAKKSIAGVFGPESLVTIPWSELKKTKYAVLTYSWGGCPWSELIRALNGHTQESDNEWTGRRGNENPKVRMSLPENPKKKKKRTLKVEYVWIDIFCLDQTDPNKMETIKRTAEIYGWASEYHVMGFETFKRGWCQCELGVTNAPPRIYSRRHGLSESTMDIAKKMIRTHRKGDRKKRQAAVKELLGFEAAGFTTESDRAVVRTIIEGAHGSVERFDAYLLDMVIDSKDIARTVELHLLAKTHHLFAFLTDPKMMR